jgi:hypothetical protein
MLSRPKRTALAVAGGRGRESMSGPPRDGVPASAASSGATARRAEAGSQLSGQQSEPEA